MLVTLALLGAVQLGRAAPIYAGSRQRIHPLADSHESTGTNPPFAGQDNTSQSPASTLQVGYPVAPTKAMLPQDVKGGGNFLMSISPSSASLPIERNPSFPEITNTLKKSRLRRSTDGLRVQDADAFRQRQPAYDLDVELQVRVDKLSDWWLGGGNSMLSEASSGPQLTTEDALQQAAEILGVKLRMLSQDLRGQTDDGSYPYSLVARIDLNGNTQTTESSVLDLAAVIYAVSNGDAPVANEPIAPFFVLNAAADFSSAAVNNNILTRLGANGEELINKAGLEKYLAARPPGYPNLRDVFNIPDDIPEQMAMHAISYEIKNIKKNIQFRGDWDYKTSYTAAKIFIKSKIAPYIINDLFGVLPQKNGTYAIATHIFDGNTISNIPYGENLIDYLSAQISTIMVIRSHDRIHPDLVGGGKSLFENDDVRAMVHAKLDELGIDTQFESGTAATAMATVVKQQTGEQYTLFNVPELRMKFEELGEAGKARAGRIIAAHLGLLSPDHDGSIQIFEDAYVAQFEGAPARPADLDVRAHEYIKSLQRFGGEGPLPPIRREDAANTAYGEYLRTSAKMLPLARNRLRIDGLPVTDENVKAKIEIIIGELKAISPIELARERLNLRLRNLPVVGGVYSLATTFFGWIKGENSFNDVMRATPVIGNTIQFFDGFGELLKGDTTEGVRQMGLAFPGVGELIQARDYLVREHDVEMAIMMLLNAALTFTSAGGGAVRASFKSPGGAMAAKQFASFSKKITEGLTKSEITNLQMQIQAKIKVRTSMHMESAVWIKAGKKAHQTLGAYSGGEATYGSLFGDRAVPKNETEMSAPSSSATPLAANAPQASTGAIPPIGENGDSEGAGALHALEMQISRLRATDNENGIVDLLREIATGEAGSAEKVLLGELTVKAIRAGLGEGKVGSGGRAFVNVPAYRSYSSLLFNDRLLDAMARTATPANNKTSYVPGPGWKILYEGLDAIVKEGWLSHAHGNMTEARDLFVVGLIRDPGLRRHKALEWGISEGDAEWSFRYHHRIQDHPRQHHFKTQFVTAKPHKEIHPPPNA
jgi:hypothetical protein